MKIFTLNTVVETEYVSPCVSETKSKSAMHPEHEMTLPGTEELEQKVWHYAIME